MLEYNPALLFLAYSRHRCFSCPLSRRFQWQNSNLDIISVSLFLFSLIAIRLFVGNHHWLRFILSAVQNNSSVLFRYLFWIQILSQIIVNSIGHKDGRSTRVWGNRNPQQEPDHGWCKSQKICFCITGVDLALVIPNKRNVFSHYIFTVYDRCRN